MGEFGVIIKEHLTKSKNTSFYRQIGRNRLIGASMVHMNA